MNKTIPGIALAGVCALLAACAAVDPQNVGRGQYLQYTNGTDVLIESEAPRAGFLNCANSAYQLIQANKALEGHMKCAEAPSTQPLPYSYRARNVKGVADQVLQSSPYVVRARTSAICAASVAGTRKQEKTEILEDNCGEAPVAKAPAAATPARAAAPAAPVAATRAAVGQTRRYFRMGLADDPLVLIALKDEAECLAYQRATELQIPSNPNLGLVKFECVSADAGGAFRYRATVQDELMGEPMPLAAKTELMCLSALAELKKVMVEGVGRPRYGVPEKCSAL
jgi:hypothetical protein